MEKTNGRQRHSNDARGNTGERRLSQGGRVHDCSWIPERVPKPSRIWERVLTGFQKLSGVSSPESISGYWIVSGVGVSATFAVTSCGRVRHWTRSVIFTPWPSWQRLSQTRIFSGHQSYGGWRKTSVCSCRRVARTPYRASHWRLFGSAESFLGCVPAACSIRPGRRTHSTSMCSTGQFGKHSQFPTRCWTTRAICPTPKIWNWCGASVSNRFPSYARAMVESLQFRSEKHECRVSARRLWGVRSVQCQVPGWHAGLMRPLSWSAHSAFHRQLAQYTARPKIQRRMCPRATAVTPFIRHRTGPVLPDRSSTSCVIWTQSASSSTPAGTARI